MNSKSYLFSSNRKARFVLMRKSYLCGVITLLLFTPQGSSAEHFIPAPVTKEALWKSLSTVTGHNKDGFNLQLVAGEFGVFGQAQSQNHSINSGLTYKLVANPVLPYDVSFIKYDNRDAFVFNFKIDHRDDGTSIQMAYGTCIPESWFKSFLEKKRWALIERESFSDGQNSQLLVLRPDYLKFQRQGETLDLYFVHPGLCLSLLNRD